MDIRRLDPAENPADLAAVLPAFGAWSRESVPGFPQGAMMRLRSLASPGYQQLTDAYGLFADSAATEALGVILRHYELTKNLNMAWADLCIPAPARTPEAYAAAYEYLARIGAEDGRSRLAVTLPESADPAAFAARFGGKLTDIAIDSALDLSAIDQARYAQWAEPSEKNGTYTIVRWRRCPGQYLPSFCAALDAMADQPIGEFEYEFPTNDVERTRFVDERAARLGVDRYLVVALDARDEVAGYTIMSAYPDEPETVEINSTGVARAHRGLGLGLRLKAAAALWLLEDRPSTRWIHTYNNDENSWMLAVNRQLGYQPREKWPCHEFALAG